LDGLRESFNILFSKNIRMIALNCIRNKFLALTIKKTNAKKLSDKTMVKHEKKDKIKCHTHSFIFESFKAAFF
jgi:hypothetical protein